MEVKLVLAHRVDAEKAAKIAAEARKIFPKYANHILVEPGATFASKVVFLVTQISAEDYFYITGCPEYSKLLERTREMWVPRPASAIPVPPRDILLNALGAHGLVSSDATRIAIWWEPCGDEAFVGDGRMSGTCNWQPYLTFVSHASVAPYLQAYNLGSSEDVAEHWLVFDFSANTAQVLPVAEAQAFLMEQWPSPQKGEAWDDVEPLSEEVVEQIAAQMAAQLKDFQNTLRQAGAQSVQDVREAHQALVNWLDANASGGANAAGD